MKPLMEVKGKDATFLLKFDTVHYLHANYIQTSVSISVHPGSLQLGNGAKSPPPLYILRLFGSQRSGWTNTFIPLIYFARDKQMSDENNSDRNDFVLYQPKLAVLTRRYCQRTHAHKRIHTKWLREKCYWCPLGEGVALLIYLSDF